MKSALRSALLLAVVLSSACTLYRTGPQHHGTPFVDCTGCKLGVVELDDQGRYFSRSAADEIIKYVRGEAPKGGATVVVFIHGWHHSAREDDGNLNDFRAALEKLHTEMDAPVYQRARHELYGHADAQVIGIYVGWRGASLPMPLADYATFWDRKPAAQRVGNGDVVELLSSLNHIWSSANAAGHYMGLVTMGHSFGGQVTVSAVSAMLRNRVVDARPDNGGRFDNIAGFGDIIVLVNPATEAATLQALSEETRLATFKPEQVPVLLVVSSEADGPNHRLFPLGRIFDVADQVHQHGEYTQNIHALGWYEPQVTHCLAAEGGRDCGIASPTGPLKQRGRSLPLRKQPYTDDDYSGVWTDADFHHPLTIQLGADLEMAGARFYRVSAGIDPNEPFVVAKATPDIIDGHNDMFNDRFIAFLVRYVAGAQLKRVTLLHARQQAAAAAVGTAPPVSTPPSP